VTQRIFPMIAYEDTPAAIEWLTEAFGFTEHGERVTQAVRDGYAHATEATAERATRAANSGNPM